MFIKSLKSVGKFLFSFLLPQKLNRRTNVVLAYNVSGLVVGGVSKHLTYPTGTKVIKSKTL